MGLSESISCPACKTDKPPSEFYLHWASAPKECKTCIKLANTERRDLRIASAFPGRIEGFRSRKAVRDSAPEGQRWCAKCASYKEVAHFSANSLKIGGWCRDCYNTYSNLRGLRLKKRAIEHLGGCCSRCGFKGHWAAYDFHHPDPSTKEASWGDKLRKMSWDKMEPELKKCRLLCRNCHAILHSYFDEDGETLNPEYVAVNERKSEGTVQ